MNPIDPQEMADRMQWRPNLPPDHVAPKSPDLPDDAPQALHDGGLAWPDEDINKIIDIANVANDLGVQVTALLDDPDRLCAGFEWVTDQDIPMARVFDNHGRIIALVYVEDGNVVARCDADSPLVAKGLTTPENP